MYAPELTTDAAGLAAIAVVAVLNWLDIRRVRHEVTNKHSTNLRDDLDLVQRVVLDTQTKLDAFGTRIERLEKRDQR